MLRGEEQQSNPLRAFGGVFVLNLPERKDRLAATRAELAKLHPQASSMVEVFAGTKPLESGGFPSRGAYGCFLGHLGILRMARDRGLSSVLVLEDDVQFLAADWARDWGGVETAIEADEWDIINLGFDRTTEMEEAGPSRLVAVKGPMMLAHCYAVHGRTLGALVEFLETLAHRPVGDPAGGPMHFDGALFHFCLEKTSTKRFRPIRSLAAQRSSRSDIASLRWFDRDVAGVRQVVAAMRSMKNRLER